MLCMSVSVHFVQVIDDAPASGSVTTTFGTSPLRSHDRMRPGAGVVERHFEIGEPDEPAGCRLARRQRHRHFESGRLRVQRNRRSARRRVAAARQQQPPLQRRRLVLRADALQIARRRMTACCSGPAPLKYASPAFAIADDDVEDLVETAVRVQIDRRVEERREVRHLRARQIELRHPAIRTAHGAETRRAACRPRRSGRATDRVRSGPPDPPRALAPWQKPHCSTSSFCPRSTAAVIGHRRQRLLLRPRTAASQNTAEIAKHADKTVALRPPRAPPATS